MLGPGLSWLPSRAHSLGCALRCSTEEKKAGVGLSQRGRSGPHSLGDWLGLRLGVVVIAHGAPGACLETFERLSGFLIH